MGVLAGSSRRNPAGREGAADSPGPGPGGEGVRGLLRGSPGGPAGGRSAAGVWQPHAGQPISEFLQDL